MKETLRKMESEAYTKALGVYIDYLKVKHSFFDYGALSKRYQNLTPSEKV
jgi:hypothetical protein